MYSTRENNEYNYLIKKIQEDRLDMENTLRQTCPALFHTIQEGIKPNPYKNETVKKLLTNKLHDPFVSPYIALIALKSSSNKPIMMAWPLVLKKKGERAKDVIIEEVKTSGLELFDEKQVYIHKDKESIYSCSINEYVKEKELHYDDLLIRTHGTSDTINEIANNQRTIEKSAYEKSDYTYLLDLQK